MANVEELKSVLKETLENRGVLSQMKAQLRAEVFKALDDQSEPKPSLTRENFLINELIREYLDFNKYKYTSSVLIAESGQPKESLEHNFLAHELNIAPQDGQLPLLYSMVGHFTRRSQATTQQHHLSAPPVPQVDKEEQEQYIGPHPLKIEGQR